VFWCLESFEFQTSLSSYFAAWFDNSYSIAVYSELVLKNNSRGSAFPYSLPKSPLPGLPLPRCEANKNRYILAPRGSERTVSVFVDNKKSHTKYWCCWVVGPLVKLQRGCEGRGLNREARLLSLKRQGEDDETSRKIRYGEDARRGHLRKVCVVGRACIELIVYWVG
jgi:hypothetical protein